MNRHTIPSALVAVTLIISSTSAQEVCRDPGIAMVFFNGVQNTKSQASTSLMALETIYGAKAPNGQSIRYELLYNETGAGLEDFAETFSQRAAQQGTGLAGRFEIAMQILGGNASWLDKLLQIRAISSDAALGLRQLALTKVVQTLASLRSNPATVQTSASHKARLDELLAADYKLVLVAHSQGNLFAEEAYKYIAAAGKADSVRIVNIAPASPQVSGQHSLANQDLVINGLRVLGPVPQITQEIPEYPSRPLVNGESDFLGHGLLPIYLASGIPNLSGEVGAHITAALSAWKPCATPSGSGALSVQSFSCKYTEQTQRLPAGTEETVAQYTLAASGTVTLPSIVVAEAAGAKWYGYPLTGRVSAVFTDKQGIQHILGSATVSPPGAPVSTSPLPPLPIAWSIDRSICTDCFPWSGLRQPALFNGLQLGFLGDESQGETAAGLFCTKAAN